MTDRQRKVLNLAFDDGASDGEIVNAVKMLRGAYKNGELFSGGGNRGANEPRSYGGSGVDDSYYKRLYDSKVAEVYRLEYKISYLNAEIFDLKEKNNNMFDRHNQERKRWEFEKSELVDKSMTWLWGLCGAFVGVMMCLIFGGAK